ncbi:hypothetical protein EVA_10835 [gut metagenome]|uniref:Uncharacterized protein n=1 Tax=gut metagenome TaxID=749906 RepID=J9G2K7_9ZZZZ
MISLSHCCYVVCNQWIVVKSRLSLRDFTVVVMAVCAVAWILPRLYVRYRTFCFTF